MFIGRVSIKIKGLIKIFNTPRITATIKAVAKELTVTFGTTYAAIKTAKVLIRILRINLILISYQIIYSSTTSTLSIFTGLIGDEF